MNTALVNIWDEFAGAVLWDDRNGYATFEYDSAFKNDQYALQALYRSLHPNLCIMIQTLALIININE